MFILNENQAVCRRRSERVNIYVLFRQSGQAEFAVYPGNTEISDYSFRSDATTSALFAESGELNCAKIWLFSLLRGRFLLTALGRDLVLTEGILWAHSSIPLG